MSHAVVEVILKTVLENVPITQTPFVFHTIQCHTNYWKINQCCFKWSICQPRSLFSHKNLFENHIFWFKTRYKHQKARDLHLQKLISTLPLTECRCFFHTCWYYLGKLCFASYTADSLYNCKIVVFVKGTHSWSVKSTDHLKNTWTLVKNKPVMRSWLTFIPPDALVPRSFGLFLLLN